MLVMNRIIFFLMPLLFLVVGCPSSGVVLPKQNATVIDGVKLPRLISMDEVEYPTIGRFLDVDEVQSSARGRYLDIEGVIYLKLHISSEGKVIEQQIKERRFSYTHIRLADGSLKPVNELFDPLAIKSGQSMVFEPATKDGKPIDAWVIQPLRWGLF
jgi:hypothetical protein